MSPFKETLIIIKGTILTLILFIALVSLFVSVFILKVISK